VLGRDPGSEGALVRSSSELINDRPEQGEHRITDSRDRDQIKRIEEPMRVARVRRNLGIAPQRQEQPRAMDGITQREIDPELSLVEEPKPGHAVAQGQCHGNQETDYFQAQFRQVALDRETSSGPAQQAEQSERKQRRSVVESFS
jgi:hypothetical protein